MKVQISLQERLKDLRVERGLTLQELSSQTRLSTSALGNYENNDLKEVNHGSLVILADFYDVTVDYLLGRTDIRKHEKTPVMDLNLSDDAVDLLTSGKINNRLLCEILTNEKFIDLMADAEIYVDGIATMRFNDLNQSLEYERSRIIEQNPEAAADRTLKTLEAAQISEEDFFCHVTHKSWDAILHDVREDHEKDSESAEKETEMQKKMKQLVAQTKNAKKIYRDPVPSFTEIFCQAFDIEDKIDADEKTILQKIFRKSQLVTGQMPRGRRR